jgi:S-adenosylmethionine hydrolase
MDPSGVLEGEVVGVDHFGNLITNIDGDHLADLGTGTLDIRLGDRLITTVTRTYAHGGPGEILALIGSRNCLEIAVNGDSASDILSMTHGAVVRIEAHGQ